jgi:hypothetical protein
MQLSSWICGGFDAQQHGDGTDDNVGGDAGSAAAAALQVDARLRQEIKPASKAKEEEQQQQEQQ